MALADYEPEREQIDYKGRGFVTVRGLNPDDLSILVRAHLTELRVFYASVRSTGELSLDETMMVKMLTDAPGIAARIIAIASDEPDAADAARKLPMPFQLKILLAIARLTFEDVGGPLVFMAMLGEMVGVQKALPLVTNGAAGQTIQ